MSGACTMSLFFGHLRFAQARLSLDWLTDVTCDHFIRRRMVTIIIKINKSPAAGSIAPPAPNKNRALNRRRVTKPSQAISNFRARRRLLIGLRPRKG